MNLIFLLKYLHATNHHLDRRGRGNPGDSEVSDYSTGSEDSSSADQHYKHHDDYMVVKWPFSSY